MNFNPIFNGNLKKAADLEILMFLVADSGQRWYEKQRILVMDRAKVLVQDIADVSRLADSCVSVALRHELLLYFSKEFGIKTLDDFKLLLYIVELIIQETNLQNREAWDEIDKIKKELFSSAKAGGALQIPENIDHEKFIDELAELARFTCLMVSFSKQQQLLEDEIIDAALPFLENADLLIRFGKASFRTVTGRCSLIAAYVAEDHLNENGIIQAKNVLEELSTIEDMFETIASVGANAKGAITSTRTAIYEATIELLEEEGEELNLDRICDFARQIRDSANDGSSSREIEDALISQILKREPGVKKAVYCANSFQTNTGVHRFLLKYLNDIKGPVIQEEIELLTGSVRGIAFEGSKVLAKITTMAAAHGLEFDMKRILEEKIIQDAPPGIEMMVSTLIAGRMGVEIGLVAELMPRGIMPDSGCECPNCQIKKIIQKDSSRSYLRDEWVSLEEIITSDGFFVKKGPGKTLIVGEKKDFREYLEGLKMSDELRMIVQSAFSEENINVFPGVMPEGMSSGFGMMTVSAENMLDPEELRSQLQEALDAGTLETETIHTSIGEMTLNELLEQDYSTIPPEYREVLEEFVTKV